MDRPDEDLDRVLRRQEASEAVTGLGWRYVLGLLRTAVDATGQTVVMVTHDPTAAAHAEYLDNIKPGPLPGSVNMGEVIAWLNKRLPDDAIVTNGAGNYAAFLHRFFQYRGFKTQLAQTSGAMGYGVPAAVAAKIAEPDPAAAR